VIEKRRMRWEDRVARMGNTRSGYRIKVERSARKRPLGIPRRRWQDYIKVNLQEAGRVA
jgi:hypothetical protein